MEELRNVLITESQSRPIRICVWIEVAIISLMVFSVLTIYSWKLMTALLVVPVAVCTYKCLRHLLVRWQHCFRRQRVQSHNEDIETALVTPVYHDVEIGVSNDVSDDVQEHFQRLKMKIGFSTAQLAD